MGGGREGVDGRDERVCAAFLIINCLLYDSYRSALWPP